MSLCRVCLTAFPPDDCDGLHVAIYGTCMCCTFRIESQPHDPLTLLGSVVTVAAAGLSHCETSGPSTAQAAAGGIV